MYNELQLSLEYHSIYLLVSTFYNTGYFPQKPAGYLKSYRRIGYSSLDTKLIIRHAVYQI